MKKQQFDPGRLQQTLVFRRNTAPRNLSGGFGDVPETVFVVRGELKPWPLNLGSERFAQTNWPVSAAQYVAIIRRRTDVTSELQIHFDDRVFKIRECQQVAKADRYMQILCEEVKS